MDGGSVRWMDLETFFLTKRGKELQYIRFLLTCRAETSGCWTDTLYNLTKAFDKRLAILGCYNREEVAPYCFKYIDILGDEKEFPQKVFEIERDRWGYFITYQPMEGLLNSINLDKLEEFIYRPDDLRAAYYQILCENDDNIRLKEGIGKALVRSEDRLLEECLKKEKRFRKITE